MFVENTEFHRLSPWGSRLHRVCVASRLRGSRGSPSFAAIIKRWGRRNMNMRAALMMSCGLLAATPAFASIHDILIGLDQKIAYGPDGQANAPPGNDAGVVMDVSNPPN